ncbi:MAG: hypothetical protein ACRESQ_07455 [Gammaproteobacteria bacterium]
MKIDELKNCLDQFQRETYKLFPSVKLVWITDANGIDGRWLDRDDGMLKNSHGVYVFTTCDSDILYIGKAQEQNSDILGRVWAHVKTPSSKRKDSTTRENIVIYPNNEWRDTEVECRDQLITYGRFVVWAVAIQPFHYAALFEIASLLFHNEKDGKLPPYNKQLG